MKNTLLLLVLILAFGCSSRKKEEKEKKNDPTQMVTKVFDLFREFHHNVTDKVPGSSEVKKAQLPASWKMAVYFIPSTDENWRWDRNDKGQILTALKQGKAKRVFELLDTGEKIQGAGDLRRAAAQQGADALLLVRGKPEFKSPMNTWAFTYIALLPMFFVEGNDVLANFTTTALLWDVRSPYVHLGAEGQGDWEMKRSLVFRQPARAIRKSKEESIADLKEKLEVEIRQI